MKETILATGASEGNGKIVVLRPSCLSLAFIKNKMISPQLNQMSFHYKKYLSGVYVISFIALLSAVMHAPHFSKDIISGHVWRQTQTQSTIISFYEEDFNILNPRRNERGNGDGIFRMEFPLFQWLAAGLLKIFGKYVMVVRLFAFVIGLFSILGMYRLLEELFGDRTKAAIGAWAFNFSPAFYYYTICPMPDNLALCFSIWGIVFFLSWMNQQSIYKIVLSGLFIALGALCKLPFVLYYTFPVAYFLWKFYKEQWGVKNLLLLSLLLSFILLPLLWYVNVVLGWHGNGIVQGMMNNNESASVLIGYLWDNLISILPEMLLNYGSVLFFLAGFYYAVQLKKYRDYRFGMLAAWGLSIIAYFVFEINMITNDHDYYSFPFYPLLFILVSFGAYHLLHSEANFVRYLAITLMLILPVTTLLRMQSRWREDSPGFNKDVLMYKTELQNAAPKDALCIVGNDISHFIFFYHLDKKGWGFDNDQLDTENIKEMINQGAQYLYSDTRSIDENPEISLLLEHLILEKGSMRVYKLKSKDI